MLQRITGTSLALASVLLPTIASAKTLEQLLLNAGLFLNTLIGLFIALAVVVFFWGLIKWLWSMGPDDAQQGLKIMFWGVVALFVMVSIWGIIRLLQGSLEVDSGGLLKEEIPQAKIR